MRMSSRLCLLISALALVGGTASASHSEVDTYYATTAGASVVHTGGSCAGNEHAGGACFSQFEDAEENVTITFDDLVVPQVGANITFRPASGADVTISLCLVDGAVNGPYVIPPGTARIVVFLGAVVNTTTRAPVCPGAPPPTTGKVTATYS